MIVGAGDHSSTNQLDGERKQIEYYKGRSDPSGEAPQLLEGQGMGRAREPDNTTESGIASGGEERGREEDHAEGDQEG